jgi:hypothetical protein
MIKLFVNATGLEGRNFAVIEMLSGNARVPGSAVHNTKGECVHAVSERRA